MLLETVSNSSCSSHKFNFHIFCRQLHFFKRVQLPIMVTNDWYVCLLNNF